MRIVLRNARVLTLDAEDTEHSCATVVIDGSVIESVQAGSVDAGPSDREIDASGMLLMPGLINGHFHSSVKSSQRALDSLPLEIFMLYESPAEADGVTPRMAYVRTLLAAMRAASNRHYSGFGRRVLRADANAGDHRCGDAGVCGLRYPGDAWPGSAGSSGSGEVSVSGGFAAGTPAPRRGRTGTDGRGLDCWAATSI